MQYNASEIEKKWQKIWDENETYKAGTDMSKPKFYGLVEFPYPSGHGPVSYTHLANEGDTVKFDKVLCVSGDNTVIGTPVVEGASVDATVVKNGKAKKIIVFKYKPKKGSKTKQGHRQPYTKVKIEKINA